MRWSRALLARIARDVPAARTDQARGSADPFKTSRILEQTKGLDVAIFGGLGGVFLLEELLAGARGSDDGLRVSEDARENRRAVSGRQRSTRRPTSSTAACR